MALEDALAAVPTEWDRVSSNLSLSDLVLLANSFEMRERDRPRAVYDVLAPHLPYFAKIFVQTGELRDRQGADEAVLRIATLAQNELRDINVAAQFAADALLARAARVVVSGGYVVFGDVEEVPHGALTLNLNGQIVAPTFQFSDAEQTSPYPAFLLASEQLGGQRDVLGSLSWWTTPNSWLGATPADLLGTDRQGEIEYALDQLANDNW